MRSECTNCRAKARHLDQVKQELNQFREANTKNLATIEKLTLEVDTLRQYGNKDCTAMADEAIAELYHVSSTGRTEDRPIIREIDRECI